VTPVGAVARREIRQRLRSTGYLASTALLSLVVVLGVLGAERPHTGARSQKRLGVVTANDALLAGVAREEAHAFGIRLHVERAGGRRTALDRLARGDLAAALVDHELYVAAGRGQPRLHALLRVAAGDLAGRAPAGRAGGPAATSRARAGPRLAIATPGGRGALTPLERFLGPVLILFVLLYGSQLAAGVVEEKTSRVLEVVLGAITPRQLLTGKVVGLCALGLGQLAALEVAGVAVGLAAGIGISPSTVAVLACAWCGLAAAFSVFAPIFATAGALSAGAEDLRTTQLPVVLLLVAVWGIADAQLDRLGSGAARVLSLLPPVSPALMPVRVASGAAGPAQALVAVALAVGWMLLAIALAGRAYDHAVLRTSTRTGLLEVVKRWRP
jgi:ABC-2 type transport system permease protein